MNIPNGAQEVIDARKRGLKPAGMLIISLIGNTGESNHTVFANPSSTYDWRWIIGLDACLYFRHGVNWEPTALQISRCNARWFSVWDMDRFKGADAISIPFIEDLDKPANRRRDRLALFRWPKFENEIFAWGD